MVADKPNKDMASTFYAEWISAGVKLSLAGLEATVKLMEAATRTFIPVRDAETKATSAASPPVAPISSAPAFDDLKLISGIGPKLEARLKAYGISSVIDVAGLSAEAVVKIDADLGLDGRVARDNWVEIARQLSGGNYASR